MKGGYSDAVLLDWDAVVDHDSIPRPGRASSSQEHSSRQRPAWFRDLLRKADENGYSTPAGPVRVESKTFQKDFWELESEIPEDSSYFHTGLETQGRNLDSGVLSTRPGARTSIGNRLWGQMLRWLHVDRSSCAGGAGGRGSGPGGPCLPSRPYHSKGDTLNLLVQFRHGGLVIDVQSLLVDGKAEHQQARILTKIDGQSKSWVDEKLSLRQLVFEEYPGISISLLNGYFCYTWSTDLVSAPSLLVPPLSPPPPLPLPLL